MPLITQSFPAGEGDEALDSAQKDQKIGQDAGTPLKEDSDDYDFEEFDDEYLDSDMEGSILNRPRPKKPVKTPSVPQRSNKRASRILETLTLELKNLDEAAFAKETEQDPHDLYLSSEEDASESADDDEDSLLSYDDEDEKRPTSSRVSSRRSQEDTARMVSFTFVGKPQVVEINLHHHHHHHPPRPSTSPAPKNPYSPEKRPSPPPHYPSSNYRLSTISTNSSSSHSSSASGTQLPPRKSSKLSNLTHLVTKHNSNNFPNSSYIPSPSPNPPYLTSDPCPKPPTEEPPKTPTSMWNRPFLQRTISAARRRPSMQKLSMAYTSSGVQQRHSNMHLSQSFIAEGKAKGHTRTPTLEELRQEEMESMTKEELADARNINKQSAPVRFEDLMRTVPKASPYSPTVRVASPTPMTPRSRTASMLGLGRRKSLTGR